MAPGVRGSGCIVPAGHAVSTSASDRGISSVSMAFECCLRVSSGSRCTHRYGSSCSSTGRAVLLYVQYKVRNFTGDAADISGCGFGGWKKAAVVCCGKCKGCVSLDDVFSGEFVLNSQMR